MKYLPLMELQLSHPYYAEGRCPDFSIEPTVATQRLLNNHHCVLKPLPYGIRVLMAVSDDNIPFISMRQGTTFTFQLHRQNPDFALFTDLTELAQAVAPTYTNAGVSLEGLAQLSLMSRPILTTESFAVHQPAAEERFTLTGRPLTGIEPADFTLEEGSAISRLTGYDPAAKIITVNSKTARKDDSFKITYPTAPRPTKNVLAQVEIIYDQAWPDITSGPALFQIAFKIKKARWTYYLVTDRSEARFRIEDKAVTPLLFSEENQTDLNQQPDPVDNVAKMLAEQYPQMQRLRFVSDEPIPCRQDARKSIQLRLNGNQVLGPLPNPSLRNYATIELANNGSTEKEDALFQVIKYFNHQFTTTGG